AINGQRFNSVEEAQLLLDRVPRAEKARYLIERNGEEMEVAITVVKQFNLVYISFMILGIASLVVGLVAGLTKPRERIPQMFYFIGVSGILLTSLAPSFDKAWYFSASFFSSFLVLPPLFVHFFLVFPERKQLVMRHPKVVPILYGVNAVVFLCIGVLIDVAGRNWAALSIPYWLIMFLLGAAAYEHSYVKIRAKEQRKPLRLILWGLLLGVGAILYVIIVTASDPWVFLLAPERLLPVILVVGIPLSFGYAIFKYRLMDISIVVKKSLMYSLITLVIAVIYLVVVYGLGQVLSTIVGEEESAAMNVAAIVLIAILFDPIKRRVQHFVDRRFYRERYIYQKALLEFSRELPTLIDLNRILQSMTGRIGNTMHIDKVAVCLYGENLSNCTTVVEVGLDASACDFRYRSGGLVDLLEKTRTAQLLYHVSENGDLSLNDEDKEKIVQAGIVLSVPLVSRERLVGILHLGPKKSGRPYSEDDIDLLNTVASQAAIAIENARLHLEELEKRKYEEELNMARRIQQGLLPKASPRTKGLDVSGISIPAATVGGDYFDYVELDDHRLLVFVGDVSGKGMSAALYMSKIQGMMQLASRVYSSPKEILVEVNCRIYDGIERKSFITMAVALFDSEKRSVRICRAGHNPIIMKRNGQTTVLSMKGMGLGLEPGSVFESELEEVENPLRPGDVYLLYSDGLTEAMNVDRDEFGESRLLDLLARYQPANAANAQQHLLKEVEQFRGGAEQNDDVTVVVVCVQ
ncbi:MAG TPA: GAF domain-containing SpoIIE family protein phosphatase, partial [Bacteroidota bacterium]